MAKHVGIESYYGLNRSYIIRNPLFVQKQDAYVDIRTRGAAVEANFQALFRPCVSIPKVVRSMDPFSLETHPDMPLVSCVTIKDILCDRSPEPYTRNAFMIFLTQNHCIETLDFIIDAEAYCDIYHANRTSPDDKITPRDPILIGKQWERLMATYICLGSPSEVNLPSCIRHRLLDIVSDIVSYPSPEQLTSAVDHAYEILTENVLVPFIRSFHLAENHDISLLDNYITERTEPTTQPKGFQIKLPFFKYCKFKKWFSAKKHQTR